MGNRPIELVTMRHSPLAAPQSGAWSVALDDPARTVMTDFTERPIITVSAGAQIDEALEVMRHAGVRSAFVCDDRRQSVLGLVTAYDIMGEKPLCQMQLLGAASRADVTVSEIMQRVADWQVARFAEIERATVAQILATFQRINRTHLAVVQEEAGRGARLRGLFSAAKLLRLTERSRRLAELAA